MKGLSLCAIAFCLLLVTALSCKKSSSSTKSNTTYISQTSWKIQSLGVDINSDGTVDYDATSSLQSCQLDNIYTFKSDGSGTTDEGATKCNASDPQTAPFTWSFKSNGTVLNASAGLTSGDANIVTLNDTNFTLWRDSTNSVGTFRIYVTLKH